DSGEQSSIRVAESEAHGILSWFEVGVGMKVVEQDLDQRLGSQSRVETLGGESLSRAAAKLGLVAKVRREGRNGELLRSRDLAGRIGVDGASSASGSGLTELLAKHSGVDAELLGKVMGQRFAFDTVGNAMDVRQQEIHCVLLALRRAHGEGMQSTI